MSTPPDDARRQGASISGPSGGPEGGPASRHHFEALADAVCRADGVDRTSLYFSAEDSDFLRFNRSALRQATHVTQAYATLAVVRGTRRAEATLTLSGDTARDIEHLRAERLRLMDDLPYVADDPWLLLPETPTHSHREDAGRMPESDTVIDAVTRYAAGLDLVGFHAAGPVVRAFADSLGSRHWHRAESFQFSWCLYHERDQAVKTHYAGTHWDEMTFEARLRAAAGRTELLRRTPRSLSPGAYRAAFSTAAMNELLGTLAWSGFGLKARRTGVSSLIQLERRENHLHPDVQISEATHRGHAPAFSEDGFIKPAEVPLVQAGHSAGTLNSPRSAREYGLPSNGAGPEESPESLALAPGRIAQADLLEALDTGLYVSDLWYLNYSDRQACRMTGMTRFACFWVEDGRLVAPVNVMRFDDSFFRMFGVGLVGLTDQTESVVETDTYQSRQLTSITTPAAIVADWRLTL